jgi:hypothetical protein
VLDGVEDQVSALAHRAGHLDEGRRPGALGPGARAVEELAWPVPVEVAGENGSELLFIS